VLSITEAVRTPSCFYQENQLGKADEKSPEISKAYPTAAAEQRFEAGLRAKPHGQGCWTALVWRAQEKASSERGPEECFSDTFLTILCRLANAVPVTKL